MATTQAQTGYAPVNGLEMYYEIHGSGGTPLVLVHGSFMTIDLNWGELMPVLARDRQVIAVEMQGHGRTRDIEREPTLELFADDIAALLDHLGIDRADILGYSLGGAVAIQVAVRHPGKTRKLVAVSSTFRPDGWHPEVLTGIESITAELLEATPLGEAYRRLAPNPHGFAAMVERVKHVDTASPGASDEEVRAMTAPVMLLIGDADGVRLEHAVEMFRLLGGGVFGDVVGIPPSRFAVVPGATHVGLMMQTELLLAMIPPFLDAPLAQPE